MMNINQAFLYMNVYSFTVPLLLFTILNSLWFPSLDFFPVFQSGFPKASTEQGPEAVACVSDNSTDKTVTLVIDPLALKPCNDLEEQTLEDIVRSSP